MAQDQQQQQQQQAQQQQWDTPLQRLLAQETLDGYALLSHTGQVLAAFGALANAAQEPGLHALQATFASPAAAPDHVEICGQQALVVQRSECSVYAVSRGKQLGATAHYLSLGVLVCVFSRPQLLQTVVPLIEAICEESESCRV